MTTQQLFLVGMILIGGYIGMRFRKMEISGLSFYLFFGIITTYAYSPFWGTVVGSAMMLISLLLFPRGLEKFWIPIVCMGVSFYFGAAYLPVSAANFVMNCMIVTIGYNIIVHIGYILTGYDWFRAFRFILITSCLNYMIFAKIGWDLLQWLSV